MSRQSSVDEDAPADDRIAKLDPYSLQTIDDAFDNAAGWHAHANERPGKRRRLSRSAAKPSVQAENQGGFIVDDADMDMDMDTGGGFIPEPSDAGDVNERPQTIPLALIPTALASLGLPSDDDEIMEVFRNASSGWSGSRGFGSEASSSVSRRDWRAVCAVLLPNGVPSEDRTADVSDEDPEDDFDFDAQEGEESDPSEEEYQPSAKQASTATSPRRKSKGKSRLDSPLSSDEDEDHNKALNSRQKRECRTAFALFFPDLNSESTELDKQRLMIKDIARCAGLLKERLSAEDIIEMLRMFSSDASNNPSISLSDFERIMTATKLV